MTVRDILIIACDMSAKSDIALKLITNEGLNEEESLFVDELTKCFNFVQNEVCTEYIPVIYSEKLVSKNGKFPISSLSKSLAYIIALKDENGKDIKQKIYCGDLVFDGEAEIEYCYSPEKQTIDDEVIMCLPDRVVAYGVLREYFLLHDLTSEASQFEEKFKNSLATFCRKHGKIILPKRIWS